MNNPNIQCPECQTQNPSDSTFCNKCGTQFGTENQGSSAFTKTMITPREEMPLGGTFAARYRIEEELGKGGMGFVYRAFDTKIQEEVALKVIKTDIAARKDAITRFSNELKFARRITHKNVCRMYDINEANETLFITMEYVKGEDLKSVINRMAPLKLGNVLNIALQVTDGMAEAHSLGIVHRDFKPQNIMIDTNGNPKIMDFGIARSMEGKGMTADGLVIGTPEYMSPEQVEGKKADHRSDIYSMGITLYEMATGKVPFSGETAFSIALKHKSGVPKDPCLANPALPEGMARTILRCLEKDPNRRFQSSEELLAALMAVEETLPEEERIVQMILPRISKSHVIKRSPKRTFIAAIGICVAVTAGIFAWKMLAPNKPVIEAPGRPIIAILPAKNNTGDATLDYWKEGLQELFITDLIQSRHLTVLDFSRIYGVLVETHLDDVERYSEEDLRDLGEEARATHIIQPSFTKAGANFRITAVIKDMKTLNAIASEIADGEGESSFYDMVDSLTKKLKPHLNLSREQIENDFDRSIGAVTTSSQAALKYYLDALKAFNRSDPKQAAVLLEQSLAIDPDFAMAHWWRSRTYFFMMSTEMIEFSEMKPIFLESNQKAYEAVKQGRVTERERLLIEAFQGQRNFLYGDLRILEELVKLYPDDAIGNNRLVNAYYAIEEFEKVVNHAERAIDLNLADPHTYLWFANVYFHWGMNEKSKEIIESGLKRFPDAWILNCFLPNPYVDEHRFDEALSKWEGFFLSNPTASLVCRKRASILLFKEDFKGAEEERRKLLERDEESLNWIGMKSLAGLFITQGRFEEAEAQFLNALERWGKDDKVTNRELANLYLSQGNLEKARKIAAVFPRDLDGSVYAKLNLWEEVEDKLDSMRGNMEYQVKQRGYDRIQSRRLYLKTLGEVEFERGNYGLAVEYFEQAKSLFTGIHFGTFAHLLDDLAQAYLAAGNLERAREEYELITTLTWGRSARGDIYARSFYRLGKIYEQLGQISDARRNYERFLELWKNADPGLPEVEEARQRLSNIRSR
ncbi:protein kinase [Acidobacteriota bacterium]